MRAVATWVALWCAVWWRGVLARPVAGETFRRVTAALCAEALLPDTIGPCPRSVPVFFGRLAPGTCSTLGYTAPAGEKHVLAGPCGWLRFDVFSRGTVQPSTELVPVRHAESYLHMPIATCRLPGAFLTVSVPRAAP